MLKLAGTHEDNPLQAALLAHGGLAALAGYKVPVIVGGAVLTWLGFHLWPRVFVTLMVLCDRLVAAAVANNVLWLVRRQPAHLLDCATQSSHCAGARG